MVTNNAVINHSNAVGLFFTFPVLALSNIEIFHPIVESKRPNREANDTPVFRSVCLVIKSQLSHI